MPHATLTSNPLARLYQVKGATPEITAVSEFISSLLATDCAGDKDLTFLTLRVGIQPLNSSVSINVLSVLN